MSAPAHDPSDPAQRRGRSTKDWLVAAAAVALVLGGIWALRAGRGVDEAPASPLTTLPSTPISSPPPLVDEIEFVELGDLQVPTIGSPYKDSDPDTGDGLLIYQGASPMFENNGRGASGYEPIALDRFAELVPDDMTGTIVVLGVIDGVAYARVEPEPSVADVARRFSVVAIDIEAGEFMGGGSALSGDAPGSFTGSGPTPTYTALVGFPERATRMAYTDAEGGTHSLQIVGDTVIVTGDDFTRSAGGPYRVLDEGGDVLTVVRGGAGG